MKLTTLDKEFIEFMIGSSQHRDIIEQKLTSQLDAMPQSTGDTSRAYQRALLLYVMMIGQVIWDSINKLGRENEGLIFVEKNIDAVPTRLSYLQRHLPKQTLTPVTMLSPFVHVVDGGGALRKLMVLGEFLLRQCRHPQSELDPYIERIVRLCLLTHGYVAVSSCDEVYLFQIHSVEITFLAAYCGNAIIRSFNAVYNAADH